MIRLAEPVDIENLQQIERAANAIFAEFGMAEVAALPADSTEEFTRYIAAGRAWVETDGSAEIPVGFILVNVVDGAAHIDQVSVDPTQARRGIGRRLIEAVAAWARAAGLPALTLTTFVDVPWNAPYYERLGFRRLADDELGPGQLRIRDHNAGTILGGWPRVAMWRPVSAPSS